MNKVTEYLKSICYNVQHDSIQCKLDDAEWVAYKRTDIKTKDCKCNDEPPNQWYKKKGAVCGVTYNGVDRYDNSVGYTIDNTRPCCKFCNSAKWDSDASYLMEWLDRVAERRFR